MFHRTLALLFSATLASLPLQAQEHPGKSQNQALGIPWPTAIAHRGLSHDAPESTEPAYIAARDLGADYLELDLQRTRDGQLIALHDDSLARTTNVAEVFPARAKEPVSSFDLAELKRLDAGSWFNQAYPERARPAYAGLKILTLDEVIDIAESGANKPGLYLETKVPGQFPGIEKDLKNALERRGWLAPRPAAAPGRVNVAQGDARVILQTFEKDSLVLLQQQMPKVPKILLLWIGDGYIDAKHAAPYDADKDGSYADYYARQEVASPQAFNAWLDFAKANGAVGTGPSAERQAHDEQSYADMLKPWMNAANHERGLLVHAYTLDAEADFEQALEHGADGIFSNRVDRLLAFLGRPSSESADHWLSAAGYPSH